MENEETTFIKKLLSTLGTEEKKSLIEKSNLTLKEQSVLFSRFVAGKSIKETSQDLYMEEDAFNKLQKKTILKLYTWLCKKAESQGIDFRYLIKGENKNVKN